MYLFYVCANVWPRNVACVEEVKNYYKIVVEKPERERPLEKPRRRKEDNTRTI
jgi:hypothetical protein